MINFENALYQMVQKHINLFNSLSREDIENLALGINGFIITKEEDTYDFSQEILLFGESIATILNELEVHDEEWLDVDFFDFSSCVGAGINSTLKDLFESEDFTILEANGHEVISWDSGIRLDE
jgi:hypothetical protein